MFGALAVRCEGEWGIMPRWVVGLNATRAHPVGLLALGVGDRCRYAAKGISTAWFRVRVVAASRAAWGSLCVG